MAARQQCHNCGYHRKWYLALQADGQIRQWCERWQRETEPEWTCVSWKAKRKAEPTLLDDGS